MISCGEEKLCCCDAHFRREADVVNAAGRESIKIVIKLDLATKEAVKTIKSVPHVQVLTQD